MQLTASPTPSPTTPLRFPTSSAPSSRHNLLTRYGPTATNAVASSTTPLGSPMRVIPGRYKSSLRLGPSSQQGVRPQSGMSLYLVLGDNNLMRYTGTRALSGASRNTTSTTPSFSGWSPTPIRSPISSPLHFHRGARLSFAWLLAVCGACAFRFVRMFGGVLAPYCKKLKVI